MVNDTSERSISLGGVANYSLQINWSIKSRIRVALAAALMRSP